MLTRCFFPKMSPDQGQSGQPDHSGADAAVAAEAKAALRRDILRRRAALSETDQHAAALALRPHLIDFIRRRCAGTGPPLQVAVFAPFRGELNIGLDWPALLALPVQLFFPRIATEQPPHRLIMAALPPGRHPDTWLQPGHFGVPEPPPSAATAAGPVPPLDLVLLPGLVFDRQGGRIGWGKAYYDRFLATVRPQPVTAGIGYDFQVLDQALPLQPHDVRLDWLITPSGIIRTGTVQMR